MNYRYPRIVSVGQHYSNRNCSLGRLYIRSTPLAKQDYMFEVPIFLQLGDKYILPEKTENLVIIGRLC